MNRHSETWGPSLSMWRGEAVLPDGGQVEACYRHTVWGQPHPGYMQTHAGCRKIHMYAM